MSHSMKRITGRSCGATAERLMSPRLRHRVTISSALSGI